MPGRVYHPRAVSTPYRAGFLLSTTECGQEDWTELKSAPERSVAPMPPHPARLEEDFESLLPAHRFARSFARPRLPSSGPAICCFPNSASTSF